MILNADATQFAVRCNNETTLLVTFKYIKSNDQQEKQIDNFVLFGQNNELTSQFKTLTYQKTYILKYYKNIQNSSVKLIK